MISLPAHPPHSYLLQLLPQSHSQSKPLSPDTKTKATNNKLQLTSIDWTLVKKHSGPRVTPTLTMSNHRQKLTSIDTVFSKKGREQQRRDNPSPTVTQTFAVTNDMCANSAVGEVMVAGPSALALTQC